MASVLVAFWLAVSLASCSRTINYPDPGGPRFAGNALFGTPALPATAGMAGKGETLSTALQPPVRIVTFNIKFARRIDRAERLLRTNPDLGDADLIFLQEMDESGTERIASTLAMNYVYYPAFVHPADHKDFGNAILSRWPIQEDRKIVLPHLGRTRKSERIAVAATVLVRGRKIRAYCLHLAAPFELGPKGRRDQIRAVLEDAGHSPQPVILAGDLNSSSVGREAVARGYVWPTRRLGRTEFLFDFDHILLRGFEPVDGRGAGLVRDNLGASDHRPVWALVRVAPSPAA